MPFLYSMSPTSSIHAGIWYVSEPVEELMALVSLDDEDYSIVDTYKNIHRKKQWLGYRALIQHLLAGSSSKIIYDPNGKPLLASGSHHISSSHAGDYAAAVISDQVKVGIDIELIRPRIERVKDRFLSIAELSALPAEHTLEHLYYHWCSKEALYKLHGLPGVDFRNDIHVHPIDYFCNPKGRGRATLVLEKETEEHLLYYERQGEWMLVVAY